MKRNSWKFGAAALAALLAMSSTAVAQGFDDVVIEAHDVAPGIYMLTGSGGNLGVSKGEDGVFLIDDQFAPLTDKIQAAIAKLSDQPIRFVLNTHFHGDHTGGNENLGAAGAVIVAHDNVRERMSTKQFSKTFGRETPAQPAGALPVVTFNDTVTFHLNGETLSTHHYPSAHTDGDAIVRFNKANVVHLGDLYFSSGYPYIDLSGGGSIDGLIAAIRSIHDSVDDATKIIPGHGGLSSRADLANYLDMLVGVREAVAAKIAEGLDLEAAVAAKPSAAWDEGWGQSFMQPDVFVGIVYESLAGDS